MPIREIPGTELRYHLIVYDERGRERRESDGTLLSAEIEQELKDATERGKADSAARITDVFFMSHGWKGDIPAAIEQYDRWMTEMATSRDLATAKARPGGFRSLTVGLHWPSLPWGDEEIPARGSPGMLAADDDDNLVELFAQRIADTPRARAALRQIVAAAGEASSADALPRRAREAYDTLFEESGLTAADVAGPPGSDQDGWDPDRIYQEAQRETEAAQPAPIGEERSTQPGVLGWTDKLRDAVLMPARQLSFWKMKDRARAFGESGGHALLTSLMKAAPDARFHLMGHSFGCIVVSATVAGGRGAALPRAVSSLFLVQGALSIWSFCQDIPHDRGKPGYFRRILDSELVAGPIVTTRSRYDSAVGTFYPRGAQLNQQYVLADELPKYGGIGTFGAQGLGTIAEDLRMGNETYDYQFAPKRVYNLEASHVIKEGGPPSGAHSDIAHPEVAHAMWSAALATP
jgi:hypothetical protein